MTPRLVCRREDGTVRSVVFGQMARIGTAQDAEVLVKGDGVSPIHARVQSDGNAVWIEDTSGKAGTFVNGDRIVDPRPLNHLDVITVGDGISLVMLLNDLGAQPTRALAAPQGPPPEGLDAHTRVAMQRVAQKVPPAALDMKTVVAHRPALAPPGSLEAKTAEAKQKIPPASPPQPPPPSRSPVPSPRVGIKLTGASGTFESGAGRCIVGRDSDATFQIDSKEVSRRHAVIAVTATGVSVQDLGSFNGTKVNGTKISGVASLKDGDHVSFASFVFRVSLTK
jgi:pSer/pThr/pTyr-binding forkhead associated (FHA) protein